MSDGNETDSSGHQPEVSAALRAQLDDLADTVNVVAQAVSDLDHRIQLSQAATTASDQRWEQRITTMESNLAELDAAIRSETERVRGSTSVLELLSHEIRSSLAQTGDIGAIADELQQAATTMRGTDAAREFEALRHRLDDVDQGLSGLASSLTALQLETSQLRERQTDPEGIVAALDRVADRQPDLEPLMDAIQRIPDALPDFTDMVESLTASGTDLASIHYELLALRSSQPDLTPVLDALQDLRDRQVDLAPVFEELRELRGSQPDVASVVDAIDALEASLPSKLLELERRFPDVTQLTASLDRLRAEQVDLEPALQAIEAISAPDLTPVLDAIETVRSDADLRPVLDEIRSLRTDQEQLVRLTETLGAQQPSAPDLAPVLEAVAELSTNLADSLHGRVEALLTAAMERQHEATEATQSGIRGLDDLVGPVAGALQVLSDRIEAIEAAGTDQARDLSTIAGELAGIRQLTDDLATTIPASTQQLDLVAQDLRSAAAAPTDPAALSDRLDGISRALDAADEARAAGRSELTDLRFELSSIREQLNELVAGLAQPSAAPLDGRLEELVAARVDDLDRAVAARQLEHQTALAELIEAASPAPVAARVEELLRDSIDDIDRAVAARQFEHRTTIAELIAAIPDPTAAVDALALSLTERAAAAETPADLLARLDALAERTEASLQSVRESIEDRLSIVDESRSTDAASIRDAVEHLESRERQMAEQLEAIAEQVTAASAGSDALWLRASDLLTGVDRVTSEHSTALESLAESHRELVEAEQTDRAALSDISRQIDELVGNTETVDRAISALATDAGSTADDPILADAIEPLTRAVDALTELAGEHRARLDAVGRSVEAFADTGPRIDEVHASLDQRIEALLDRQADLVASVQDLHPRFDALDTHDPREGLGEVLTRFSLAEADLGAIGPRLEGLVGALDRTEQRVTEQAAVLDRMDGRSEQVAAAVSGFAAATERLAQLDELASEITALSASISEVDLPGLADRLSRLTERVEGMRAEVGEAASNVIERVELASVTSAERLALLDEQSATDRSRTGDQLSSLSAAAAEINREVGVLRGDLAARHDDVTEQLASIRAGSANLAEVGQQLVEAGGASGQEALGARLDLFEQESREANEALRGEIGEIRRGLAEQFAQVTSPLAAITRRLSEIDLDEVTAQLHGAAENQQRTNRDVTAAIATASETNDSLNSSLGALSAQLAAIDLEPVRTRLQGLEDEQRAAEQRLAASLSNVHALVATFELEPVLGRLESLELQSAEAERSLHAAISDVRTATLSIDLGHLDGKISELQQRNRVASDDLARQIGQVVNQVGALDLGAISDSLAALQTASAAQREELRATVDSAAVSLDVGGIQARLDALDRQTSEFAVLEAEVRTAVRAISEQLGSLDLHPISTRLDQLVEAVHATDEASRSSLAGEIEAVSRRISELDTERISTRLGDLSSAHDRLHENIGVELSSAVEEVRAVVDQAAHKSLEDFAEATSARDEVIRAEITALRDAMLDQFADASQAQRQSVIERIDTLGNTVVDRLDDTRIQTDHLSAQVTSIHAAFASSGPSGADIRSHVDAALEGLAERIGTALRDLRREVTGLGSATETSGLAATIEASLDRLTSRFDADITRVLDALSVGDDSDRLRRIDAAITEIRRDFEVLRRLSDQTSTTDPD